MGLGDATSTTSTNVHLLQSSLVLPVVLRRPHHPPPHFHSGFLRRQSFLCPQSWVKIKNISTTVSIVRNRRPIHYQVVWLSLLAKWRAISATISGLQMNLTLLYIADGKEPIIAFLSFGREWAVDCYVVFALLFNHSSQNFCKVWISLRL